MAADIEAHGGVLQTGFRVTSLAELEPAKAVLLDVAPPALARIAGSRLPASYRRALESFRFGNGACKVDFILSGPVPWAAAGLAGAGTVHVGGTRAEMAEAENDVSQGRHPERPYVLVSQPSVVDASRAPEGRHILWTTAMFRRGPRWTWARPSWTSWSASRPGSVTWWCGTR